MTKISAGVHSAPLLKLKNDYVFKKVFGEENQEPILRGFLTAALHIPPEEFEGLTIVDTHLRSESIDLKESILDVRVKLKNNKFIAIEIQVKSFPQMAERLTYYTCLNLTKQMRRGGDYRDITRVVTILIADYVMLKNDDSCRHVFALYDEDTRTRLTDLIEIHILELRKLPATFIDDEKMNELQRWLWLIKSESEEEIAMLTNKT
jgi:predicted transposase/invertase (TIGR01784 family)